MIESQSPQLLRHIGYRQNSSDLVHTQSLVLLNHIKDDHLVSPVKEYACRHCGSPVYQREALYETFFHEVSCDPCVEKRIRDTRLEEAGKWWKRNCPEDYQDTDIDHPEFNRAAWDRLKQQSFSDNIVLIGETGSCKSRIACYWAKMAIAKGIDVSLKFPDDLKDTPRFKSRRDYLVDLAGPQLMVCDDLFLASASREATADLLKDLIDRRLRHKKATIITTQVNSKEFESDSAKFGNMTDSEAKRIEAIVRRVKEKFVSIDCEALMNDRPEEFEF